MKLSPTLVAFLALSWGVVSLSAQNPAASATNGGLKKLAIGTVKVGKAVLADASDSGRRTKMQRMTENLNAQLL